MGVKVLSPESNNLHSKHLRSLPKLPNSHYSMKPLNTIKHPRTLPTVPNSKVDPNIKTTTRALPRVPKPPNMRKDPNHPNRYGRILPEVPFKELNNSSLNNSNSKDGNTSGSSRTSTPHQPHHEGGRKLPKLPKLSVLQKQKPEQNRIEYMHDVYKKEGDVFAEDGNYEQALKSYNLALRFISDHASTIIARSRVHRKLGKNRKAMQDAELALQLDPLYHEALLQKAELLLEAGDYENALKFFQNGARMRPDKEDFHDGIQKAKHGISEHHKGNRKRKNTKSPEENGTDRKKSKDKTKKNHDNANFQTQRASSNIHEHTEPVKQEQPPLVPVPPAAPAPSVSRGKLMTGRQMTPMPGKMKMRQHPLRKERLDEQPMETETPKPPKEEDVDNEMMKKILGQMYPDKDYLEKLLSENDISLPNASNLGSTAENGLHFLYDRVLNWVRQGEANHPSVQPTPLPRETKTSARRKAMAHNSSVESIVEELEKENERRQKKGRKKRESKAPHSWYNYLENKKAEEAHERKQYKNIFLHVVEGRKINPREHSNVEIKKSKGGPDHTRRKEGKLRRDKDHESKESLSQPFIFRSYRPGSDMRNSKDSKGTPHTSSEHEEPMRTPPKTNKLTKKDKRQQELERRRAAVAKFVAKEMEEIEMSYADAKYNECIDKANHVLEILEREDWPEKYVTMATLNSFIGNACIGKKNYEGGLKFHHVDLEIGEKHKIDDAVSRALGNLGRIYVVQKRHQEALDVFLRKTPMCASRIETAWLFHEIGNCFLALGDFEYAKDAAKKSLEAAEEAVEWSYQLQSCVLMGVAEVKLKQYHAAFNTFEKALDQARLQGDEKAEDAIREALQDVNDRIVEEMRTKGPMNFPDARSDAFLTPISRDNSSLAGYQYQGLSRSRAEIARMQAELGYRCRADYAKTPAAVSDYSSIFIPDDDGSISLTETEFNDGDELQLQLDRIRTSSTIFGSTLDLRDNIRAESFVSGKGN